MRLLLRPAAMFLLATGAICAAAGEPSEGVLVLFSGQVFRGRIEDQGDQVLVTNGPVRVQIDRRQVEFRGATLVECYVAKARGVAADDVIGRHKLAEWCLENRLLQQAEAELKITARLAPKDVQQGLLERRLAAQRAADARREPPPGRYAAPTEERLTPESTQPEPLPAEAVSAFAQTAQPLLLNRCATGACHGPRTQSGLRLERLPAGQTASRRQTLHNLDEVRRHVNPAAPDESPLIVRPLEAMHGGRREPIFASRRDPHYLELVAWVRLIAQAPQQAPETAAPLVAASTAPPAVVKRPQVEVSGVQHGAEIGVPTPVDPFDPEIFNRRFLARPASPAEDSRAARDPPSAAGADPGS